MDLWLVKIGEIGLKKGNRAFFERILKQNIQKLFRSALGHSAEPRVTVRSGRYYVETMAGETDVAAILSRIPGIVAFSKAERVEKSMEALVAASVETARRCLNEGMGTRFKFEIRRTDKSLPLDSYGYARELGSAVGEALPELSVDVRNPDFTLKVELREQAYIYGRQHRGVGGLQVGTGGRGLLLPSGGIDSPVAGFLMAKRGVSLRAVHFHTPPFTSAESHEKVVRLAGILGTWCGGIVLHSIPFTDCQVAINRAVDPSATTLHSRACMMQIADRLARKHRCGALITGEALGQVASQTMESLGFTDRASVLPVFRPLLGMDKEDIIRQSRAIGTYDTAIEPFDDCCTIFSPERPLTRPNAEETWAAHDGIEGLDELMNEAIAASRLVRIDPSGRVQADALDPPSEEDPFESPLEEEDDPLRESLT